jgi:hypothetical protein
MALYDELVAMHCRFWNDESYDANTDAMDELEQAIIRISKPMTVGDVMAFPNECLRVAGLIYLIEKDASDKYEQIEGHLDFVLSNQDQLEEAITSSEHGFNGHDLCEWIDQTFPVTA